MRRPVALLLSATSLGMAQASVPASPASGPSTSTFNLNCPPAVAQASAPTDSSPSAPATVHGQPLTAGTPSTVHCPPSTDRAALPANPIVSHLFTADPAARVFGDRLYVYTSHDEADSTYFDMFDWRLFSTADLATWQDHGSVFGLKDFAWAEKWAWAPDAVQANGNYYLFLPTDRARIGVAIGDSPTGPFRDALGSPLLDKALQPEVGPEPIDPAVLLDDDGSAYLYFGCRFAKVVKLAPSLTALAGPVQDITLLDPQGNPVPVAAPEKQPALPMGYGEAPFLFKREGRYYFVYSNGWAKESTLVYATGSSPTGPFTYQGEVMKHVPCVTHHGSVVAFRGKWYVVYHTSELSGGNMFRRAICIDELTFDSAGRIVPVVATPASTSRLR